MKQTSALAGLRALGPPFFTTRDVAVLLKVSPSHANKILTRLAEDGFTLPLARGRWCLAEGISPLAIAEHLTAPYPAYISLQTALYHHGMISQIPAVTYAVSLARTKRYETPLGTLSIHHIQADFLFGYETAGSEEVKMAIPEKALLDILYLSPARSRLFASLPELEIPESFRWKLAYTMSNRLSCLNRRTLLVNRLGAIQSGLRIKRPSPRACGARDLIPRHLKVTPPTQEHGILLSGQITSMEGPDARSGSPPRLPGRRR